MTEPQGETCIFLRDGNGRVFLISEKTTVKGKTEKLTIHTEFSFNDLVDEHVRIRRLILGC